MPVATRPFAIYEATPVYTGLKRSSRVSPHCLRGKQNMGNNVIHNDLGKAVKLFNRWQFQEAADAFSKLVNEFDGPERTCFEGIAELCHGFFRIWNKGGEPNAMVDNIQAGWEIIQKTDVHVGGLDMKEFHQMLPMCLEEAIRWRRGDVELFNRDLIPRIEYVDTGE